MTSHATLHEERRSVLKYALRGLMQVNGVGVRQLGRELDPENPERGKRNVNRWLSGDAFPSPEMQYQIEARFGLDQGYIARLVGGKRETPVVSTESREMLEALHDALSVALGKQRAVV